MQRETLITLSDTKSCYTAHRQSSKKCIFQNYHPVYLSEASQSRADERHKNSGVEVYGNFKKRKRIGASFRGGRGCIVFLAEGCPNPDRSERARSPPASTVAAGTCRHLPLSPSPRPARGAAAAAPCKGRQRDRVTAGRGAAGEGAAALGTHPVRPMAPQPAGTATARPGARPPEEEEGPPALGAGRARRDRFVGSLPRG